MQTDFIKTVQHEVLSEQKQKDGIAQIVTGFYLVLLSALLVDGKPTFVAVLIPLIPILVSRLRKIYTYPRIGFADVGERKATRKFLLILAVVILVGICCATLFFPSNQMAPNSRHLLELIISLVVGILILGMFWYRYRKEQNIVFLIYGVILLALVSVIYFAKLHIRDIVPIILVLGLLDFGIGIRQLLKFIKAYPVINDES